MPHSPASADATPTGGQWLAAASRRLVPTLCEVCRHWGHARLCGACLQRFAQAVPRCACCGLQLGMAASRCGDCLRQPPPYTRTVCAVDYRFPWDGLITAFKFRNQPELATPLARCMAGAVQEVSATLPQMVLPVPLAPARLAERGYNQAWELAGRLGPLLGLPARADWLSRPVDTPHQLELNRQQRQHNLRAAFLCEPAQRKHLQGLHVALVDDVMTTGATVSEAAAELLRAGAVRVDVWVLARTAAPNADAQSE